MHTVRARALQSVVNAPAACRTSCRHTASRRTTARAAGLGAKRGFRSSAPYSAQPDESNGVHSKDDNPGPKDTAGTGEGAADAPPTSQEPEPASVSDASNAADSPAAAAETAVTPASAPAPASASATATSSTYVGGRTRVIRPRSTDGTPSFTLPEWFKRHHVRSYENHDTADSRLLSTSLSQDLEAASLLMYPRSSLRFSTEPQSRPVLPRSYEVDEQDCDRLQVQRYFTAILDGSGWTDHKVELAVKQMRAGKGLDTIARRGAAVAAAAVYLTTAIACRGNVAAPETRKQDDDELFNIDGNRVLDNEPSLVSDTPGPGETASADSQDPAAVEEAEPAPAPEASEAPAAPAPEASEAPAAPAAPEAPAAPAADGAAESGEMSDAAFNAALFRRLDPHGVMDLPRTPFGRLADYMALAMRDVSEPFLAAEADISVTWGIPISAQFSERAMFREIQATVAAELLAPAPDAKAVRRDWRRPVSVVAILNYWGRTKAEGLMDEIALTLAARIVHIDAKTIAALAGPYLGQTPLLSRGSVAMLGYTAARLNGRLLPRYPKLPPRTPKAGEWHEEDDDADEYVYSRDGDGGSDSRGSSSGDRTILDLMSTTRSALRSDAEDRWDDLKMNHVLEAIVRSADADASKAAAPSTRWSSSARPPLIIHVHNFIELSSTLDGNQILYKLRSIADRLWQKEWRKVVLVGSTSAHMKSEPSLVDRAEELRQEDCHIIPFQMHLSHDWDRLQAAASEETEIYDENMHNICAMVSALTGNRIESRDIPWLGELLPADHKGTRLGNLVYPLGVGVHDIHWVYRLATLWVGLVKGGYGKHMPSPPPEGERGPEYDSRIVDLLDGSAPDLPSELSKMAGQTFFTASSAFPAALSSALSSSSSAAAAATGAAAGAASSSDYSKISFIHTLWAMNHLDKVWCERGGAMGPYSSPLLVRRYRKAAKKNAIPWWWIKTLQSKSGLTQLEDEIKDYDEEEDEDYGAMPGRGSAFETEGTVTQAGESGGAGADPHSRSRATKKPNYDAYNFNKYEMQFVNDIVDPADLTTTFDNIVLPAETKDSIKALTSLSLIRPEAFRYGVLATEHIPGCLLYGPPGTGKTLLAKAVAKQSGAKMLEISAASINDMWIGETEKNVRAVFSVARALAPIVVFIDEADALLAARHEHPGRNGQREMMNQFLREWDGLTTGKAGGSSSSGKGGKASGKGKKSTKSKDDGKVFIMVATNRPGDLDEAVLRRLPRRILVDLPLRDARLAILRVMLRAEQLDEATVSLEKLADDTDLYSGSDLKNLCVAAAMQAVREEVAAMEAHTGAEPYEFPEKRVLTGKHFERAKQEIGASISEDMASLQAIRRFDDRYGDHGSKKRKKRKGMGFEVVPKQHGTREAMVRQA